MSPRFLFCFVLNAARDLKYSSLQQPAAWSWIFSAAIFSFKSSMQRKGFSFLALPYSAVHIFLHRALHWWHQKAQRGERSLGVKTTWKCLLTKKRNDIKYVWYAVLLQVWNHRSFMFLCYLCVEPNYAFWLMFDYILKCYSCVEFLTTSRT